MSEIEIASLSESGQIHLPKEIRDGFKAKDKFAVIRVGDSIVLKRIDMPDMKEYFKQLLKESRKFTVDKKITPNDVSDAIKRSRKR